MYESTIILFYKIIDLQASLTGDRI